MNFYLESASRQDRFRLQADKSWKTVETEKINEADFTSQKVFELISLQSPNCKVTINKKEWVINPKISNLNDRDKLYYHVYCARDFFPLIPSKEQLTTVMRQGDDRIFNSLILNVFGFFELRNFFTMSININDPTIAFRFSTFGSYNGYVGPKVTNEEIDILYLTMMEYWNIHLKTGKTNMHGEDHTDMTLEDVMTELNLIKKSFELMESEKN